MLLWFVFWCVWHSSKVLKMLVFPSLGGFCGVAYSCLFGFRGFRCFLCFLVFCASFWCCFCFCFVCFVFVSLLDCFWCWFFFSFFVCFSFFCFFGGFKGQVRWPKGPPHLALNPAFFCFSFCFFGGFKGQVRWPKGPPHLALNPPYFLFFFCFYVFFSCFPFFAFNREKLCLSPKDGHFCLFLSVSLCFALAFFWASSFSIFSLCASLLFFAFFPSFLFSHFCIWFLLFFFCFVCFFVSSCSSVLFSCLLSSFVLNHNIGFIFLCIFFLVVVVVFCFSCFGILLFFWFLETSPKTSLKKMEIPKTAKMKMQKKRTFLTRAVRTVVSTNRVFFFSCFYNFCTFCCKHYKSMGFSPKKQKNNKFLEVKKLVQV